MLGNNLLPLPIYEVPETDTDEEYDSFHDLDEVEGDILLYPTHLDMADGHMYPPPHPASLMDLIGTLPFHLNLDGGNEDDFVESEEEGEDDDFPSFGIPFFGVPHNFLPYPSSDAVTLNGPQIWEVLDDEGESEGGGGGEEVNGNGDDWETSSEEEVVGGDEENLGKEECLVPEEEESNQLGDVAPAH